MWLRVMDCAIHWMGKTGKQIKRQLTRLKEFQRKEKLKQNRKHKKTPPDTKRKHRSATQQWLNGRQSQWRDSMTVIKTNVFRTSPYSSSYVLSFRFVPKILRCSFPVCWSRTKDEYHLQLAKFSAAVQRIGWSSDQFQSHPNELYLVLKNCYGKRSGSALALDFSFFSVVIMFYLSSIFVSKGGNFAAEKNSWAQLVGQGRC